MAFSLASISRTKNVKPPRIVLHGEEKVGKSTFFAGAPNPIFIRTEDGLNGIDTNAFPLCQSYQDVIDQLNVVLNEVHQFNAIIIDSLDWLEKLIHHNVLTTFYCGAKDMNSAGKGYGQAYGDANYRWREILNKLDEINTKRLMYVGLIAHSKLQSVTDPQYDKYDTFKLKLHSPGSGNGACEMLREWADVIGFAEIKKFVIARAGDDNGNKTKTTGQRVLNLEHNAAYMAGNRYGLPAQLDLAWAAFQNALFADKTQPAANDATQTQLKTAGAA